MTEGVGSVGMRMESSWWTGVKSSRRTFVMCYFRTEESAELGVVPAKVTACQLTCQKPCYSFKVRCLYVEPRVAKIL